MSVYLWEHEDVLEFVRCFGVPPGFEFLYFYLEWAE